MCTQNGIALKCHTTGAQTSDISQAIELIEGVELPRKQGRPRTKPQCLTADKGYDGRQVRQHMSKRGIKANIPERKTAEGNQRRRKGRKPVLDQEKYRQRNQIERLLGRAKQFRRIATRYDKYARVYEGFLKLGFVILHIRDLFSNTT